MGKSTDFRTLEYDGIKYTSLRSKSNSLLSRIANYIMYKKRLKQFISINGPYSDILYVNAPPSSLFFLKKYAMKHNINLYHDSVEWYSPEEFLFGKFSRRYRNKEALNTKWIDKQFKVFAISSFLHHHFMNKGISSLIIPAIMDKDGISFNKKKVNNKLVLSYAGHIGKKDYIKEMLEGLALLNSEELEKIEFNIFGANETELKRVTGISEEVFHKIKSKLNCRGRVPREVVLQCLVGTDFTVLLRHPELRYAKAGFPTKVVESLFSATPVICNISSDLDKYLMDNKNAIIVEGCSAESFARSIKKALRLTDDNIKNMQIDARETAERFFDYRIYIDQVRNFLATHNVNE